MNFGLSFYGGASDIFICFEELLFFDNIYLIIFVI